MIDISAPLLVGFVLAFVRSLAWLLFVPPFGNRQTVPLMASVGIALSLAVAVAPHVAGSGIPLQTPTLIGAIVLQALTGVALGFLVQLLISAVMAAGAMTDLFGGLVLPPSVDPLSGGQTPVLGQFYEQVAIVLLFAGNGEYLIVNGFLNSFGATGLSLSSLGTISQVVTTDVATFFTAALEIAAPLLIVLFAAQVVLGMLSKAVPQMNVYWLGFPFQILLTLLLVGVSITVIPDYLAVLVTRALTDGAALLRAG